MRSPLYMCLLFTALFGPCCQADANLRLLSPIEALDLGLGNSDGPVWRLGEPSHGDAGDTVNQIAATDYTSYSAFEMRGISSQAYFDRTAGGVWCDVASDDGFGDIVVNDLPKNATVQAMRIWGLDADTNDDLTVSLIRRCFPTETSGGVITTVISELTSSGSSGNFSEAVILPTTTIDNNSCSYTLRTRFSTPGSGIACADSNLRLQKVRLQWIP
ncbi:MAG: hypothetical protein ABI411_09930 [Tahibacter sp.]